MIDRGTLASTLAEAGERLMATVDTLPDQAYAAPSLCPGWSRAHVLAHLALNAEGLARGLRGVIDGVPATIYASQERRDGDIADLAGAGPESVRTRLAAAIPALAAAIADLPPSRAEAVFERTPGGRPMIAGQVPYLRLREVEIHHADADAGYHHRDWPRATSALFLERSTAAYAGSDSFHVRADDLDRTWSVGPGEPGRGVLVSGPASALAWWLTGRSADELTCTDNDGSPTPLPRIEGR